MAPCRAGKEAMEAADVASPIEERPIPGRDLIIVRLAILDNFRGFVPFLVNFDEFVMLRRTQGIHLKGDKLPKNELKRLAFSGKPREFDSLCELREVNSLCEAREFGSLCEAKPLLC